MKRPLPSLEDSVRILRTTHTKRIKRAPPAVKKQVQPILKSLEEKFAGLDDGASRLRARWPEVVGESLAKLCEPVRIIKSRGNTGGALEIRVGGAYATLIQHQAPTLLGRINLFLGADSVIRLRLVQGPLTQPPPPAPPQRPLPLSASDEVHLQHQVADVPDAKLRTALLRLGRAVTQRNRT